MRAEPASLGRCPENRSDVAKNAKWEGRQSGRFCESLAAFHPPRYAPLGKNRTHIREPTTRPAPELSTEERAEVKKIARELLKRMKALLVINWRQKIQARAKLRDAIESELDAGLPRAYTPELFNQKCNAVFEHVYDKYPEPGTGVYSVM